MVLLARQVGLPARLVNGFAGGRTNAIGGFVELTQSDAHAWVEVHYADAGWVRYDPTPPDLRSPATAPLSLRERARDLASALELWWFQSVVGFDRSDQMNALRQAWLAWRARSSDSAPAKRKAATPGRAWGDVFEARELLLAGTALAGIGGCCLWLWRRRQHRHEVHASYQRALSLLERRGISRATTQTARDHATEVHRRFPGEVGDSFRRLTEAYLAERFGDVDAGSEVALLRLEAALAGRPRGERTRPEA